MGDSNNDSSRSATEDAPATMDKAYCLPENYNPSDYPPVKLRNNNSDKSEAQRKRRSKNRLSNRRSTGYVAKDVVDEAMSMGSNEGGCIPATNQ